MLHLSSRRLAGIAFLIFVSLFSSSTALAASDYDNSPFVVKNTVRLQPDVHTGSFVYSYPFTLPPGRNGMQPSLALNYNSQQTDNGSEVGFGWSLSIPSIERMARYGTDDLYDTNVFTASGAGELEDVSLTDTSHGTYGAKVEDGSFLTYVYNSDESWTVTDKHGAVFTYGASDDDRLSDPSDTTHVFRWMLSSVEDLNGNTVVYTYSKDGNQLYPESINYTGHDTDSGLFDVLFTLESRDDVTESFATGFSVETAYRVSEVQVDVDGNEVRHYDLDYDPGDNGVRSLLTSITESATTEDGTSTLTKPATTFDYSSNPRSWTEDTSFATMPETIGNTGSGSMGIYVFDVNADGLPDLVKARYGFTRGVYINGGDHTWTLDSGYSVPRDFSGPIGQDMGARIFDLNGDGYQDLVFSRYLSDGAVHQYVYLNNADGTGWTTEDTAITVPVGFTQDSGIDMGVRVFDVDGDGMQDIVRKRGEEASHVYINNGDGTGWTEEASYTLPVPFATAASRDIGVRAFDVNGDGLVDLVYGRYTSSYSSESDSAVYINNGDGTGWTQDTDYTVPQMFLTPVGQDMGVRPMDINSDGFVDLVYSRYVTSGTGSAYDDVYINNGNGTGWTEDASLTVPMWFTIGSDVGVREQDIDGDGLDDILYSRYVSSTSTNNQLWIADGDPADRLTTVTNDQGGSIQVGYEAYRPEDGEIFFPMQVVKTLTTDDALGHTYTTSYDYASPAYYYADQYDRKFVGFGVVTTTDALGNVTKQYFHQGNDTDTTHGESTDDVSKAWKMYAEEVYDDADQLYKATYYNWVTVDLGDNRDFVFTDKVLTVLCNGEYTHVQTAVEYAYDTSTGNLITQTEYGTVALGSSVGTFTDTDADSRTIDYTYADWTTGGESGYLSTEVREDNAGHLIGKTERRYDTLSLGSVSVGNATSTRMFITGSAYAETGDTYDAYGQKATETDPRGNVTTLTPDSVHLYSSTVTDALGHDTDYTYDYSSGRVVDTTDANGYTQTADYDAFDRPLTVWQPDVASPTTLVEKTTYAYDDSAAPNSVTQTDWFDDSTQRVTVSYVDGFGRKVQTRTQTATSGTYNVSDSGYDALGHTAFTTLPYEASGEDFDDPTTDTTLYQTNTYDPLGRVTTSENVEGTTTKTYSGWEMTETDANGNSKTYTTTPFGQLGNVEEVDGSFTYTTSYLWTPIGNLSRLTDADGNQRDFHYDFLGRRTQAQDLHAASDTTFGVWDYAFDLANNLSISHDPIGVTTAYTYDAVNRMTVENASSTTATDVTYSYDSCTNGVGRLCSAVVNAGATTAYVYDALGRVSTETKTIGTASYATSYTYDRQGNIATVTYPDGSTATYTFNTVGQPDGVSFTDVHGSTTTTVATDVAYGANGKVRSITYGNGVTTTFTYDAADLYRLKYLETASGSTMLQDFGYLYDAVGNLTDLTDDSDLYAAMAVAYDYDDLYRLTDAVSSSTDSALAYTKAFTFGPTGNLLTSTDAGTYAYNGTATGNFANPHAATTIGSATITYNKNGNVLNDGTWANSWNYRNALTQSVSGTTTVGYQYDHTGKRVKTQSPSGNVITPSDYETLDGGAKTLRHILFGDLGSIATSTYDSSTSTSSIVYHHKDHLGGTHVESDSSGTAIEYILYKPFGDTLVDVKTGSYENKFKYTGKQKDVDTGYYYYGSRYYNAVGGRFQSEDPVFLGMGVDTKRDQHTVMALVDPQSQNSYAYARGNPVRFLDPSGDFWGESFLQQTANLSDTVFNFVTFGAGDRVNEMVQNGVTVGGVASVAAGVVGGALVTGAVAAVTGATAGAVALYAAPAIPGGIAVGTSFGKLGTVIESQAGKITQINDYATGRMNERMVMEETIYQTVANPLVTLQQSSGRTLYLTQQAAVVLDKVGRVVTAYSSSDFKDHVKAVIDAALK